MKAKRLEKMFLREKPTRILLELKDSPKYATKLSKKIDCTYSHTLRILQTLQKFNLVEFEKKGRIKIIRLTQAGRELANTLHNFILKLQST